MKPATGGDPPPVDRDWWEQMKAEGLVGDAVGVTLDTASTGRPDGTVALSYFLMVPAEERTPEGFARVLLGDGFAEASPETFATAIAAVAPHCSEQELEILEQVSQTMVLRGAAETRSKAAAWAREWAPEHEAPFRADAQRFARLARTRRRADKPPVRRPPRRPAATRRESHGRPRQTRAGPSDEGDQSHDGSDDAPPDRVERPRRRSDLLHARVYVCRELRQLLDLAEAGGGR